MVLDVHAAGDLHGHVRLGREVYFGAFARPTTPPRSTSWASSGCGSSNIPKGSARSTPLHVPVGRPIRLLMTSEDVIHSLFVPDFRIHMDVLPERYTSVWFQATQPGTYRLYCSQYCGTNHAGMTGNVIAMEPADYDRWLQLGAEGSMALEGRKVFLKYRCASCHSADAEPARPVLENLFGKPVVLNNGRVVKADENYIREKS